MGLLKKVCIYDTHTHLCDERQTVEPSEKGGDHSVTSITNLSGLSRCSPRRDG